MKWFYNPMLISGWYAFFAAIFVFLNDDLWGVGLAIMSAIMYAAHLIIMAIKANQEEV